MANPFDGICPNYGFFERLKNYENETELLRHLKLPENSTYKYENRYYVVVKDKNQEIKSIKINTLDQAWIINDQTSYKKFLKDYDDLCGNIKEDKLNLIPYHKVILDLQEEKRKFEKLNSLYQHKDFLNLSEKAVLVEFADKTNDFELAHWNEKEFPNLFNRRTYKGNEFELKKAKEDWKKIRNNQYVLLKDIQVSFGEYDFTSKSLPVLYEKAYTFGSSWLVSGSGLALPIITFKNNLKIKLSEKEAEAIKSKKYNLSVVAKYKEINEKITYSEFMDNGQTIILDSERTSMVLRSDPSLRYSMKEKNAEYKYLLLTPMKFILYDPLTSEYITDLK